MSDADKLDECITLFKNRDFSQCAKVSAEYLRRLELKDLNDKVYAILYYKGASEFELGKTKRKLYAGAFEAFEIFLQNYKRYQKIIDREDIKDVKKKCREFYDSDNTIDEIDCRATYCVALSHYLDEMDGVNENSKKESLKKAVRLFESYLENIQLIETSGRVPLGYTTLKALHFKGLAHMRLEEHTDAVGCFLSELKQIEAFGYAHGSYNAMFNAGLSYLRLDQNREALYYFNDALLYLNTQLLKYEYKDKFDIDLIKIEKEKIEYEEDDTIRHIAIAYGRLGDNSRAILNYRWIKSKNDHKINALQDRLVNAQTADEKKSIYEDDLWKLYFDVKNNLAMIHAEQREFDDAEREIDFVNNSTIDESYVKAHMVDTKGYVLYKKKQYKEALNYFEKALKKDAPPEGSKRPYWFHKGNCHLQLKELDKAIDCYNHAEEASSLLDDRYLDAVNNKAVAYHNINEKDRALSDFKKILKLKYNYIPAHHNLLKLSVSEPRYSSFWNYWQGSRTKKCFAGALIVSIFAIIAGALIVPGLYSYIPQLQGERPIISTENTTSVLTTTRNSSGLITTNATTVTNTTKPVTQTPGAPDIPLYTLIVMGILALILLSPIIKSASIGTTSVELTTVDRAPEKPAELEFIEK